MNLESYKILEYLADGKYHSGEKLAHRIGATRAAVSKKIAKLNDELNIQTGGYLVIQSTIGKGYCLNNEFDVISFENIKDRLSDTLDCSLSGKTIIDFEPCLDSTNNYLINKVIGPDTYHVCIAEMQYSGRGRSTINKQKTWHSPFGNNIYCSIGWQYPGNKNALIGLSLVAGISVVETLEQNGIKNPKLKWPNDILVDSKKVSGVLIESFGETNGCSKLVVGFGINVHNNYTDKLLDFSNSVINKDWTNIVNNLSGKNEITGFSRNKITADLIVNFINNYQRFISYGLKEFLSKWQKYDLLLDKTVQINIANNITAGIYKGINEQGALLVEINGEVKSFYSGEVSLGNLYGCID